MFFCILCHLPAFSIGLDYILQSTWWILSVKNTNRKYFFLVYFKIVIFNMDTLHTPICAVTDIQ